MFSYHTNDWCHVCGKRKEELCDVQFLANSGDDTEYIRICRESGILISETICGGEHDR